jgi:TPR repeat protein
LEGVIVEDEAALYKEAGDYAAAERGYRKALALLDNPTDVITLAGRGFAYKQSGKYREALADWTAAAARGDAYSQNELGVLNMNGIPGVIPANPDAGIEWFRKAAAQGNSLAIRNLDTARHTSGPLPVKTEDETMSTKTQ